MIVHSVHSRPRALAPRPVAVATVAAVALLLAALAATTDRLGQLLCGVAAALVAAEALRSALVRPTIRVGASGLSVAEGVRRVEVAWSEIQAVRTVRSGHLVPGRVLEVETEDRAFVFGSYRLGMGADEAAAVIEAAWGGRAA